MFNGVNFYFLVHSLKLSSSIVNKESPSFVKHTLKIECNSPSFAVQKIIPMLLMTQKALLMKIRISLTY